MTRDPFRCGILNSGFGLSIGWGTGSAAQMSWGRKVVTMCSQAGACLGGFEGVALFEM